MAENIFIFLLASSFGLLAFYAALAAFYRRARPVTAPPGAAAPKVTILKPIKNIDDGLEENLESFLTLDYPAFELFFGVDTKQDACVAVIEKAAARHPSVAVRIIETGHSQTVNPKIDKLFRMSAGCTNPLYWVSDSNTRVNKETLSRLVGEYTAKGSKIVFSPLQGTGGGTIGSMMANSYLNLFVSGNIIAAWKLVAKPIIVGKSMLIERETLEKLGGFSAFDCYLAEDYMMGRIYKEKDLYISTNYTWITNFSSTVSVATFYSRMSRWAKMRLRIDPFFYCLEILANPLAIAFVSIFIIGAAGLKLLVWSYLLKLALEYFSLVSVNEPDRGNIKVIATYPVCVIVKDAILAAVYVSSFFSSTVKWHGRRIKIGSNSMIQENPA